jgi:hypothetical protein
MNAIKKAVDEVKFRIPRQLLEKVFVDGSYAWRSVASKSSVDEQMLNMVIRPRVLVDCNLVGGVQMLIPLEGLVTETPNIYTTVVHIPKTKTDGRSIISAMDIIFSSNAFGVGIGGFGQTGGTYAPYTGDNAAENGALMSATMGVLSAADKIPMVSTANVTLIGENTIMIRDHVLLTPASMLRCIVENEDNLASLQLRNYGHFADLVTWAIKAYIYNELVVLVDTAELRYGQAVGAFKDIFMGYADAEQNYQDYLRNTMQKVMFMNDRAQYRRLLKLTIGGNH